MNSVLISCCWSHPYSSITVNKRKPLFIKTITFYYISPQLKISGEGNCGVIPFVERLLGYRLGILQPLCPLKATSTYLHHSDMVIWAGFVFVRIS